MVYNTLELVLVILSGILMGPFIAHYGKYVSDKISERDLKDNEELIKNGEEPMLLPEGLNLYRNSKAATVVIVIINALLFSILYMVKGISFELLIYCVVTAVLVLISIVDFQVYEIPIECNYVLFGLGIIHTIMDKTNWINYIIGFFTISLIFLVVSFLSKGKAMGGGDIKLMATLGLLLGWKQIILVMIIGSVLGSVIHGLRMLISKKSSVLAFGPYLSIAAYIGILYGNKMIEWYIGLLMPTL